MTIGRWTFALVLLIAAGVAFVFLGSSIEDPYADLPASSAGPLPWLMVPSLYALQILYVTGVIICIGAIFWKLTNKIRT
jgi:hypothetical protein